MGLPDKTLLEIVVICFICFFYSLQCNFTCGVFCMILTFSISQRLWFSFVLCGVCCE